MAEISIAEARVSQEFPEIDPNLRIGEIELDADPIELLFSRRIAGHEERELLMPLAGSGDLLLRDLFDFGCDSFHHDPLGVAGALPGFRPVVKIAAGIVV